MAIKGYHRPKKKVIKDKSEILFLELYHKWPTKNELEQFLKYRRATRRA
jgi:hypothetical protein